MAKKFKKAGPKKAKENVVRGHEEPRVENVAEEVEEIEELEAIAGEGESEGPEVLLKEGAESGSAELGAESEFGVG